MDKTTLVGWWASGLVKPNNRASPVGKQANHASGVMEMHPYPRFAGLPPEGEVLAALMLEVLMSLEAQQRANLPLRGRCRRQKGCISNGPKARLYGFRCRQAAMPPTTVSRQKEGPFMGRLRANFG